MLGKRICGILKLRHNGTASKARRQLAAIAGAKARRRYEIAQRLTIMMNKATAAKTLLRR